MLVVKKIYNHSLCLVLAMIFLDFSCSCLSCDECDLGSGWCSIYKPDVCKCRLRNYFKPVQTHGVPWIPSHIVSSAIARMYSQWKAAAWRPGFGFSNLRPSQKPSQAVTLARLGPAYFGSAWLGSRPEAGPSTALVWRIPICPFRWRGVNQVDIFAGSHI